MHRDRFLSTLRFCIPQSITALRLILGAAALYLACRDNPAQAVTLIVLGVITDGADGALARRLGVEGDFGALFDYFADYLCYIVAPVALVIFVPDDEMGPLHLLAISLPLLTAALRYARMDGLRRDGSCHGNGYPGVATVFYACFVSAWMLLGWQGFIPTSLFNPGLFWGSMILSALMVAPLCYPKLVRFKGVMLPVVVGLGIMPFVWTTVLALSTIVLTVAYIVLSPLLFRQRLEKPPRTAL